MSKLDKQAEYFIRFEIACTFESYCCSGKHHKFKIPLQQDVWNDKKFDKFTLEDFREEYYWIIKPAFKAWTWIKGQKKVEHG